jgi:hypothetical protein
MITSLFRLTRGALVLAVLASAAPAHAGLLVDVQSGSAFQRGSFANFGYSVTFTDAVRVDALGLWDQGANGLVDAHQVGIWDSTGTLLAQAVVDNASIPVTSVNPDHAWLFTPIAKLYLAPGTYKLGAYYPSTADQFVAALDTPPAQILLDPLAIYGDSFFTSGGTEFFTEPTSVGSTTWNPAFFGPNARVTAVPEPATLALMGLGLALAGRRWKRRA